MLLKMAVPKEYPLMPYLPSLDLEYCLLLICPFATTDKVLTLNLRYLRLS